MKLVRLMALAVWFFLSCVFAMGQGRGSLTILVLAPDASSSRARAVVLRIQELRKSLGLSEREMPVRVLTSRDDEPWIRRLGTDTTQGDVLGVALWNETDSLGPRRFLGDAFVRTAGPQDCARVVQSFLRLSGRDDLALPPFSSADALPIPSQRGVQLRELRFEASGSPLFFTNMAVRLSNESLETIRHLRVSFYVKRPAELTWRLAGHKEIAKIASFQSAVAEYVGSTKELLLLDIEQNAIPCHYKVEVSNEDGQILSESGSFVPSEKPVE